MLACSLAREMLAHLGVLIGQRVEWARVAGVLARRRLRLEEGSCKRHALAADVPDELLVSLRQLVLKLACGVPLLALLPAGSTRTAGNSVSKWTPHASCKTSWRRLTSSSSGTSAAKARRL